MITSKVILVSLCICIYSIWFSNNLHEKLFETNEDQADKAREDASESDWRLYRWAPYVALVSGLIAVVTFLATIILHGIELLMTTWPY
jgi:Ca2+/H+ antiporter